MCFYISINACLLSGLYIYSILYPSWVHYGNYHVLINKHSLKRNQHDLKFSLLNTVSYFPLWQCPWGRQSAKISTDQDPRMMMSGLNILPVFKQHQSQKRTTIKLQKIKRKSYTTNAWVFLTAVDVYSPVKLVRYHCYSKLLTFILSFILLPITYWLFT